MTPTRVVRLAGREFAVVLARGPEGLEAQVSERGATKASGLCLVPGRPGRLLIGGRPVELALARRTRTDFSLRFAGRDWPVEILSEGEAALRAASTGETDPSDSRVPVRAPMPGRVLEVLVAEGDVVEAGSGLFVIEAMKMENEIRSPRGGRVLGVLVEEGAAVEQDQTLCHLGPAGSEPARAAAGAVSRAPA